MVQIDDRALEYLVDNGESTGFEVAFDIQAEERAPMFRARLRILAEAGFVSVRRRDGAADKYSITGWGMRYLEGEVDADLRRPMPGARPPDKVRPDWWAGFG
jgi:hypothetical protein